MPTTSDLGTSGTRIDITETGVTFRTPNDSHLTDVEREAAEVLADTMCKLVLSGAAFAHEVLSVAVHRLTDAIPTAAVTVGDPGTGTKTEVLLVNPEFATKAGPEGMEFVLCHEPYHLLKGHLYAGTELANCEHFTLACEVVINHRVMKRLGRKSLPLVDGKPTGVDPQKVYAKYREAKKDKGEDPVSFEQFVSSDLACRSYIMEIPRPPKPRHDFCQHPKGDGGDGSGDAMGNDPLADPSAASDTVAKVLDSMMQRAINGDKASREELLDIGGQVGEDHPLWGTLGLGLLRGETLPSMQVKFWEYFLTQDLASILEPGCKLEFPRRLAGLSELYEAEGAEMPFMPLGQEPHALVDIYLDMSGSIGGDLVTRIQKLVGEVPGATARWRTFDTDVYEFEPGEALKGGGGTSFDCIVEHVESQEESPDAVIILTDGYAPEVYPSFADEVIWLITPGGNAWPRDKGMRTVEVDV